jgi:putative DNA primase/helicase
MSPYQNAIEALQRPERFAGEHDTARQYIEQNATPEEIANYENRLRVVNASELLTMEFPAREYVIDPILQTQGTAMLYSKRGVGKTYLSLGIGCAIAAGANFLRWTAPKPRKVLYLDGEMPAVTMRERLASIIESTDGDMDPEYFRLITPDLQPRGMPSLSGTIGQSMVEDQLHDAELLVLDNLSTLCRGGKENEAESWLPVQDWVLSLRRRGISVLLDHHAGKNGAQRGTSRKEDALDTVLMLRHPSNYTPDQGARFEIHFEKARNVCGAQLEPFEVQMRSDGVAAMWLMRDITNALESLAKGLFGDGRTVRDVADELKISKSAAHRLKAKIGAAQ